MEKRTIHQKIDFIGIGAAKSGTTWVSACLAEHPDILFSTEKSRKELSFFNSHQTWQGSGGFDLSTWEKGFEWYFDQFPPAAEGKIRGEFTVTYMIDELARQRIKEYLPHVKLLVILRNPADMLYSLHHFGLGSAVSGVTGTFEEAFETNKRTRFGFYFNFLKAYFEDFPSENIYVGIYEELKQNPVGEIKKIYEFLGVDSSFVPPSLMKSVNASFKPRSNILKLVVHRFLRILKKFSPRFYFSILDSNFLANLYSKLNKTSKRYAPMSAELRKRVIDFYAADVKNLEILLGRDLSVWKL